MSNGIPTDPVQAMLAQTSLQKNLFTATSRYYGIDTETLTTATQAERLDNIAAKFLGDPELFWRIADANGAMRPEDLVRTVGRKLRITLPQGIAGSSL